MPLDYPAHGRGYAVVGDIGDVLPGVEHIERPHRHEHKQRNSRLVYFGYTLKGYEEIAHNKHDYY